MKPWIVMPFVIVSSVAALAGEPNLFDCSSQDGKVHLVYTTTSLDGKPTFTLDIDGKNVVPGENNFVSIHQDQTALGQLVAAEVVRKNVADLPASVYAVQIPHILLGQASSLRFDSVYLEGFSGGFRATPLATEVVTHHFDLTCEAKVAAFATIH